MIAQPADPRVALIVAMAENRVIGRDGGLPWHLSEDLKHFKRVTMGKPMVMGRKTFESIGKPLPGRTSIVVTRDRAWSADGVEVTHGIDEALDRASVIARRDGVDEVMVIGGAEIYAQALPWATRIYLTAVRGAVPGDAHFPELDHRAWKETGREDGPAGDGDGPRFSFVVLERRTRDSAATD